MPTSAQNLAALKRELRRRGRRNPLPPLRFCPKCGCEGLHLQEMEGDDEGESSFDCYCKKCEWSGDISPDE